MSKFSQALLAAMFMLMSVVFVSAQVTTGSVSGTVTDPKGAVVPGATVTIKNNETGAERTVTTNENGAFTIPAVGIGTYTATITASGFKKIVVPDAKVQVNIETNLNLQLEVGGSDVTVTVTSAQDVINTSTPSLTTIIDTRQVVDLPLTGRNPVELAGLQAGVAVVGQNVRGASVSGTRQTAVNLTQDGINAMDNFVKTSSFFALTTPSLNATQEFSVTTGTAGAENGRGVGQVNMVTKSGTNEYHGGAFLQLVNDWAYANTFFNNTTGTAKPIVRQHYAGVDIGGPVHFLNFGEGKPKHWNGKDKAFFFFSFERFKQANTATRNRLVLTPEARQGTYRYIDNTGTLQTLNLLTNTGNRGFGINPIMTGVLAQTALPNNDECGGDAFNIRCFKFNVTENTFNNKYVVRYDHQLVKDTRLGSHKLEFVYSKVITSTHPDVFTNGVEAPFPGGVNAFQSSVRSLATPALVSTFGTNWTNTLRYGRQWAPVIFDRDTFPTQPFIVLSGVTTPDNRNLAQPRNTIVNQVTDDLSYLRGNHLFKFGADFQRVLGISQNDAGIVETITLGAGNGTNGAFVQSNLPNSSGLSNSSTILNNANSVYADIVGLLSSATQTFNVTSPTSGFVPGATRLRTVQNSDLGLYAQDQWRARSNLTLNLGVRWEFMGVPTIPNGLAIQPKYQDIYGISGFGNLFKPTAPAGPPPPVATLNFVSGKTGIGLYKNDWNNFAPNLGFAWQPRFKHGPLHLLLGGEDKTSIRGGYSISYIHDGITTVTNALGTGSTNPGLISVSTQTNAPNICPPAPAACPSNILFGVLGTGGVPLVTPTFKIPITDRDNILAGTGNGLWTFDPNLRQQYIQQWNIGIEREIMKGTAIEVRYVGNYGGNLWRAIDINGQPIINENGFLQEFLNAQKNLAARGGTSFAPGCAGCVPLPIFDKFFGVAGTGGVPVSNGSGYGSSTFISNLTNNNIGTMAFSLANSSTYRTNRESVAVGLPANFFLPNPNANFAAVLQNGSKSWYNAMEVEVRRRYANGLQFQADYTWSKAMVLGDAQGNNQSDFVQPLDFRNLNLDKRRSSQDQTQRFVSNAIYDLPFGHGKAFFGDSNGLVDRVIGHWTIGAIATWASGNPWYITSGQTTVNEYGATGINLTGISYADLKKNIGVYRTAGGVFFVNPTLLNITISPTTGKVTQSTLKSNLYSLPAPGTLGTMPVNGLSGPHYFSLDMSLTKRIPITERVRMEFKATAINVLNHANFSYGTQSFNSTSFGRITSTLIGGRQVNFIGQIRF